MSGVICASTSASGSCVNGLESMHSARIFKQIASQLAGYVKPIPLHLLSAGWSLPRFETWLCARLCGLLTCRPLGFRGFAVCATREECTAVQAV